jgi:hypothetical protein
MYHASVWLGAELYSRKALGWCMWPGRKEAQEGLNQGFQLGVGRLARADLQYLAGKASELSTLLQCMRGWPL